MSGSRKSALGRFLARFFGGRRVAVLIFLREFEEGIHEQFLLEVLL